jgi:hypothetical protein
MDYLLVTELRTNITNIYVLHGLVGLHVANLHHEGVRAIVLSTDEKLSHDHGMVGSAAERANPPLGGSECGGVDGEGLVLGIPGSGSLETANVGSVTQLGLGIATDDLVLLGALKEVLVLFGAALFAEGDLKREGRVSF